MITETRPVPCGNPRVMATVAYHEHELRCASCLQVLLDAANLQVDEARKALEIISEFDARDFAQFGAQALMDAVAVAKIGLSKMKPTEKPKSESEMKERLERIENGQCPECGEKAHLHNCTEKRNRVCGFWTAGIPCAEHEPCPKHGTMPTNRL